MKKVSWIILGLVVVGALIVGSTQQSSKSIDARTNALASTLRCPVCSGEAVIDSQAPVAQAMRADIKTRLGRGESPAEIREFYVSKYGNDVLLKPKTEGVSLLVWLIPLVIGLIAAGVIFIAVSRWRVRDVPIASAEEQSKVEKALGL